MKFIKYFILITAVLISVSTVFLLFNNYKKKEISDITVINISIHEVDNGYGYSISSKNKVIIRQNFIPVLETKQAFSSISDAQSVANLVKNRIESNKNPKITKKDLDLLEISIGCVKL